MTNCVFASKTDRRHLTV